MDLNSDVTPGGAPSNVASCSALPAKPKRVRRTNQRRPKVLPANVRQKLAVLGHNPRNQDTTDANLSELIEKMSSDLQNYSLVAQSWQKKLVALRSGQMTPEELMEEQRKCEKSEKEAQNLILSKAGLEGSFEADIFARLHRTASPTLDYLNMPLPKVRSALGGPIAIVQSEQCFQSVLSNVADLANLFGMFKGAPGTWANITKLKPDFSEARARDIWTDVFQPIDTSLSSFQWASGPCSRNITSPGHLLDPDDSDSDHFDRRLAASSDFDVVDMLHYCSLLLIGFNQAIFDNETYAMARDHLGKQVERLLREAIFTRNIGASRDYAHGLLAGILGVLRHFSSMARSGAVVSLLEIAWATCMQHIENIHPIMKGVVSFVSTVLAPSQSRRAVWMARNQENFQSTTERYFHLTTTAYFAASYYALTTRDDDALLHYLAQLDEILLPTQPTQISGPFYEDPTSCFHLGKHPNALSNTCPSDDASYTTSTTATSVNSSQPTSRPLSAFPQVSSPTDDPFLDDRYMGAQSLQIPTYQSTSIRGDGEVSHSGSLSHIQLQHSTSEMVSPCFSSVLAASNNIQNGYSAPLTPNTSGTHSSHYNSLYQPTSPTSMQPHGVFTDPTTPEAWDAPPRPGAAPGYKSTDSLFQIASYHVVANTHARAPNNAKLMEEQASSSSQSSSSSPSPTTHRPPNSISGTAATFEDTNTLDWWGTRSGKESAMEPEAKQEEEEGGSYFSDNTSVHHPFGPSSGAYIPNEDFKSCLRSAVHLIRAEAALLSNDYPTCRHWVDEAEREMNTVPDMFLHHKIFLVDVSVLKQVFNSPCPFPGGNHSVAEEFERRVRIEAEKRKAKFPLHRSAVRGDSMQAF